MDLASLDGMRHSILGRAPLALLFALLATSACKDGASRYSSDGDTGAAAPATKRDMSETQNAPSGGSDPTAIARSDSVRAQSGGPPGTLTTKSSSTPAIKPGTNP
jgi:hypothetical protein